MYHFTRDKKKGTKAILRDKGSKKPIVYLYERKEEDEQEREIHAAGTFSPIPSMESRDVLYVAGPSGSGKSTYVLGYLKNFNKVFPDASVYLFSRIADEKAYNGCYRVELGDEFVNNIPKAEDFPEGSLLIFDDVDTIQDKALLKAVLHLRADVLEIGRHRKLYIVITSHLLTASMKTREVINEATEFTFFPMATSKATIKDFLIRKQGIDNSQVKQLLEINTRWLTISLRYPRFYFTDSIAVLFN